MDRRRLLLHSWLQAALWVGIALVANHIGSRLFTRIDVTSDQRFSLSAAAQSSVARLDKPLLAAVYFTEDLDPPYHEHLDALRDKLDELAARSGGMMEVRIVDPTGDKDLTAEARQFGIRPVTYTYEDFDRREARHVFMGVSFVYGERQQAVAALPSVERMEYELVRAIRSVTTEPDDRKVVGWLTGNGEPDLSSFPADNPMGQLISGLAATYELRPVHGGTGAIPEEVDALLIIGPQKPLNALTQFHLDQFVMRGGSVAWFLSSVQPDFEAMRVRKVGHGLQGLLAHYGVELHGDVMADRKNNEPMVVPVEVEGQRRLARINYPLALATANIDRRYHTVRDLERVVIPFANSLAVRDPLPPEVEAEVWVRSGPQAVSIPSLPPMTPSVLARTVDGEVPGAQPLVVAVRGHFQSFFAARPIPEGAAAEDEALTDSRPVRMVVGASGDMVANNRELVQNSIDWLFEDASLVTIRSKGTTVGLLDIDDASQAARHRAAIVGFPLGLVGMLGLLVWFRGRP